VLDINPQGPRKIVNNQKDDNLININDINLSESQSTNRVLNQSEQNKLKKEEKSVSELAFLNDFDSSKTIFYFALVITVLILIFGGFLYYLKINNQSKIKTLDVSITELNSQINSPEMVKINKTSEIYSIGLAELSGQIKNPTKYSILFSELEKITPNEIRLTGLTIDNKGKINISAESSNLEQGSKFIKSLEDSVIFSEVTLDSNQQSSSPDKGRFYNMTLSAKFNKILLTTASKETNEGN